MSRFEVSTVPPPQRSPTAGGSNDKRGGGGGGGGGGAKAANANHTNCSLAADRYHVGKGGRSLICRRYKRRPNTDANNGAERAPLYEKSNLSLALYEDEYATQVKRKSQSARTLA